MKIDLASILKDVYVDPANDPEHVTVTAHTGGVAIPLSLKVGSGIPQALQDVTVAAAPSIAAGHFTAQTLLSGLLLAYLTHQSTQASAASTPKTAEAAQATALPLQ